MVNSFVFTRTVIDAEKFLTATHNQYKVVSVRPYTDKKNGVLPDGYNLTLMIMVDDMDYGTDKNGVARENNLFQQFNATVLNRHTPIKKGDTVRLIDFNEENSYYIDFNLLLRFNDYEVMPSKSSKANS